jgi:hypothetical protein
MVQKKLCVVDGKYIHYIGCLIFQGNGTEEVVCCGWDGQTYIVNHTRDVVRYQFEEDVTAFTAGNQ